MNEDKIIGHQAVLNFLEKSLQSGRLAQAYLFVGPAQVGKKKLAQWLVGQVVEKGGDPLNQFNVRVIDRAINQKTGKKNKDISLEQIREAQDFLSHSSLTGKIKAVIIEGAESLNPHAANALLKILEEPRPDCLLILLTENTEETLPTLVSRCQIVRFNPVASAEIDESLRQLGASSDEAGEISRLSFGLPGRAIDFWQDRLKLETYQKQREEFFQILKHQHLALSWRVLESYFKNKKDHQEARERLLELLGNWLLAGRELLIEQASTGGREAPRLSRWLAQAGQSQEWLNQNIHPKLVLENLVLDLVTHRL